VILPEALGQRALVGDRRNFLYTRGGERNMLPLWYLEKHRDLKSSAGPAHVPQEAGKFFRDQDVANQAGEL